jgi:hypothetical protein
MAAQAEKPLSASDLPQQLGPLLAKIDKPLVGEKALKVRLSWGHQSPEDTRFYIACLATKATIADVTVYGLEGGEGGQDGPWKTQAGGGRVAQVEFALRYSDLPVKNLEKLNPIWADLMARSDADTARRLRADPGYRPDGRRLTVQMDRDGTRGFSVTVDQLLQNRAFWVPALDVYLAVGLAADSGRTPEGTGRMEGQSHHGTGP